MRIPVLVLSALLTLSACGRPQHVVEVVTTPTTAVDETSQWNDASIIHDNVITARNSVNALIGGLWIPTALTLLLAFLWQGYHRRRARIEMAWSRDPRLIDGPAVLQGVVETDGEDAITVSIVQHRRVWKDKQGRHHTQWIEKQREVVPRPFTVKLDDGRSVRVEPDERVDLRDRLESPERVGDDQRRRRARLQREERVWVAGVLHNASSARTQSAYRAGAPMAVLRPPRFGRLIVSTEAPGAHFTERADHHFGWFRGALITFAVAQLGLVGDFSLQAISGRPVSVSIVRAANWRVWVKPKSGAGHWEPHCAVDGRVGVHASAERFEVSCAFHGCAQQGRCQTLPMIRPALVGGLIRDVGRAPTLNLYQAILAGVVGWGLLLMYFGSTRLSRAWHAGGRVDES
jgi:hypothetical protein